MTNLLASGGKVARSIGNGLTADESVVDESVVGGSVVGGSVVDESVLGGSVSALAPWRLNHYCVIGNFESSKNGKVKST